jgi:hypothetical protein
MAAHNKLLFVLCGSLPNTNLRQVIAKNGQNFYFGGCNAVNEAVLLVTDLSYPCSIFWEFNT